MSIAFVQSLQATTGGAQPASLAQAFGSNNVAGNFLVCVVRVYTGGGGIPIVLTDSLGNTWIHAGGFVNAFVAQIDVFYCENCLGGANTLTASLGSGHYIRFAAAEYSGVATSSSLDVQNSATGTGTAANSGNVTTTNASDLLVGFCENDTNGALSVTPGAGWTQRELVDGESLCDQIVSSTGTYAFSATIGGSVSWGAGILAFKAGASVGAAKPVICIMQ
jgi:hypothetical protein